MTILAALTPASLAEFFDPVTLSRGTAYALSGRVREPSVTEGDDDTANALAWVEGTRPTPYAVQLDVEREDEQIWLTTICTCPVQIDCKHGAALALTVARSASAAGPTTPAGWREQLGPVLHELVAAEERLDPARAVPLALEIGIEDPHSHYYRRHAAGPSLRLRPMRLGARGRWVKTGADWRTLSRTSSAGDHPAEQLGALHDIRAAVQIHHPYWHDDSDTRLDDLGPRAVALLARAVEAGVVLLAGRGVEEVRLVTDPVDVVTDLSRHADGDLGVRIGIDHADRLWSGRHVVPAGTPVHTVGLRDDHGHLAIASTSRPLPPSLRSLLVGDDVVDVPAVEADEVVQFLAPYSRLVPVRSDDASVEVPEPVRPTLLLRVTWHSAAEAELSWRWRYADRQCAFDASDRLGGVRDRAAERTITDSVPPGLLTATRVTGGEALALAVHDLPALRALDDIEVQEEERPDFRETTATPRISFDLVPPEPEHDRPTDWLDLDVAITVEGESIPLPVVLSALTTGTEYLVLPSGLYLRTDRPEFDRLRDVVRAAGELREAEGDRVSVGRHDLGVWAQLAELGVVDTQAAEWVRRARALRDLTDLPRPEPTGVTTELRSYQRDGFHWLAFLWQHGLGGILADDMGLGKTLQVIALVAHAVGAGEGRPFLVVAPTSVVTAWESEAARHAPGLRVRTIRRRADDVAAAAAEADLVVTTYALLRLAQHRYAAIDWAGLVLDEAQQVKNHQSKTYAAVRLVEAPFRLAVTGTPFENRLMELWALLSITVPGLYPWPRAFTEHVVRPVEKGRDAAALRRFRQRIQPFLLRRTKELVAADLPPKQEQVLPVKLSPRHRKVYDAHFTKERQRILGLVEDFDRNRVAIFSALTKLRQLALDPALVDPVHDGVGSAKLDLLAEHLTEMVAEGHRALVFSQFTTFLGRVAARLEAEGIATTYLDGSTRDRAAVIDEFRAGGAPVFLISLKAGGVGLTLTEADYVFVLDPWWNPAAEAQAVDRAHRIGQTRRVHVYRLIAEDTIEEKVLELKDRKAELFAQVVDGGGTSAAGITAADIRALFGDE